MTVETLKPAPKDAPPEKKKRTMADSLTLIFHRFDEDKSGFLEKKEAKIVADKMSELGFFGISETGFWGYIELMRGSEKDGDGKISLEEFLEFGLKAYEENKGF